MVSWPIQNDITECLFEFLRSKIKDKISDYYGIIAGKVSENFTTFFSLCKILRK